MSVRLLLVTDLGAADLAETERAARAVLEIVDPRVVALAVRDHDAPARVRAELARSLLSVARPRGARVIVHDRLDLARAVDADGVQLGERSVAVADARALLGAHAWIGRSCHDERGLREARAQAVDAVTLSPLFASPGKGPPLGAERFAALRATVPDLAVLALGGVAAENAVAATAAGATGLAMIRGWLRADRDALERIAACVRSTEALPEIPAD
ncbi:MAG: thiamine phosphate synthase [Deltaproteobacteria bacterium]|nr:thiamine phosphate synthase [Deltaproteobacteria bacterium]